MKKREKKKRVSLFAKRKHFCEKLSKSNSSKQLYGLTNELLENSKSSVCFCVVVFLFCFVLFLVLSFPSDIPESELPDHFSSFFDLRKKNRIYLH